MRTTVKIFVLLIFLQLKLSEEQQIAIVEHQVSIDGKLTPEETLNRNADKYIELIESLTKDREIFVIVFPEATLDNVKRKEDLKSYSVEISNYENPCTVHSKKYPKFFQKLSCAAIKHHTALVLNLIEEFYKQFYTSDVVLLEDGSIMFSIRRELRLGENFLYHYPIAFAIPVDYYLNYILAPNLFTMKMVKFTPTSLITGFGFSYEKIITLAEKRYYFVCSNWISELPFLTSLQVHQMWAQEFNLTLLFSGANNPKMGQGGTGIFDFSSNTVAMDIVTRGGTKAYVYDLNDGLLTPMENKSVDTLSEEMDSFHFQVDLDLYRYESMVLNTSETNSTNVEFSVRVSVEASTQNKKQYTYHLVAYKGYKTYYLVFEPGGVEICGVIACLDSNVRSCGKRFDKYQEVEWPITFEEIVIKANFSWPLKERIYSSSQFPNSLLSSMRPLSPNFTTWSKQVVCDDTSNVSYLERTFALTKRHNRILTFAIFGRNFTLIDARSTVRRLILISPLLIFVNIGVALF